MCVYLTDSPKEEAVMGYCESFAIQRRVL
jgi:hypothetical protein